MRQAQSPIKKASTLNSWKEIASYLGRGVRTVQRWETELQLPVHRIGVSERSPVFAFKAELDVWMLKQAGGALKLRPRPVLPDSNELAQIQDRSSTLEKSARLTSNVLNLLQRQRAQTKQLAEQVQRMAQLLPVRARVGVPPPATPNSTLNGGSSRRDRRRAQEPAAAIE